MATARALASAFAHVERSADRLTAASTETVRLADLIIADHSLREFLERRDIALAHRVQAIAIILGERSTPELLAFLALLIERRSLALLSNIARHLAEHADAHSGTARVDIASAHPITTAERGRLTDALRTAIGRPLRTTFTETPALLAGVRVTVDGAQQWDDSLAGKFAALMQHLRRA